MFGAFKPVGRGVFGPTREGKEADGWEGTFPGRLIVVALPGLVIS